MVEFRKSRLYRVGIIAAVSLVAFLTMRAFGVFSRGGHSGNDFHRGIAGDTLSCTILIDNNLNTGSPTLKFATDLIRKFAEMNNCTVDVSVEAKSNTGWDNLVNKKTDAVVFNTSDSIPPSFSDYLNVSAAVEDRYACAVRYDDENLLRSMNYWISHFRQTSEYGQLLETLHRREKGTRYRMPITRHKISDYDKLVKRHSATIGWDWRLISALIYQESKFNNGVVSRRGAIGLMQIKEETARKAGINNIYDPDMNIKAGVAELARLERLYGRLGIKQPDLLRFVLAAYNAGEGRIRQIMEVARAEGKDPKNWDDLVSVIPLMRNGYTNGDIKTPPFIGREVELHVKKVERQYYFYRRTVVE